MTLFKFIDLWAGQSGDRAALLVWATVGALVVAVILAVAGIAWYTAPAVPAGR